MLGIWVVLLKVGCPEEDGPDWDFGASVILAEIDNEKVSFLLEENLGMFMH